MSDSKKPPEDQKPKQGEFELEIVEPKEGEASSSSEGPDLGSFLNSENLPAIEAGPPPISDEAEIPPPLPPNTEESPPNTEPTLSNLERPPLIERTLTGLRNLRVQEKLSSWGLREKFLRFLPASAAGALPASLDPVVLTQWAQRSTASKSSSLAGWLTVTALSAYFLADIPALMLGGLIPTPPPLRLPPSALSSRQPKNPSDYQIIYTRNLFNSTGKIPGDDGGDGGVDLNAPAIRTTLPLNLVGTVILRDELRSLATLEDKAAAAIYPVRVDDEIPGKLKVLKVQARRVEFINTLSGRKEYVDLPEENTLNPRVNVTSSVSSGGKTSVEKLSDTQFNVSRSAIDASLSDMAKVLTQARAIPHSENGQMVGFKLFSIVPGSIYDQLGLKNGDLLCGVDGEPINDPAKAMTLVQDLKNKSNLQLCVKRNGRTQNFAYEIR